MNQPVLMSQLSFALRRELEVEDKHRFGVNDLAVSQDGLSLFSAGRDGIARQWAIKVILQPSPDA